MGAKRFGWVIAFFLAGCLPFVEDVADAPPRSTATPSREVPVARLLWQRRIHFGLNPYLGIPAARVAVTTDGSVVIAGGFYEGAALGDAPLTPIGRADAFISKLDAGGSHAWTRRYASPDTISAMRALAPGASNDIFVSGHVGGFPVFLHVNASGSEDWWRLTGAAADTLRVDGDELVALGYASGHVDFGGGASVSEWFLARLSITNGAHRSSARLAPQPRLMPGADGCIDGGGAVVLPESDGLHLFLHRYAANGVRDRIGKVAVAERDDSRARAAVGDDGTAFLADWQSIAKLDREDVPVWRTGISTLGLHDFVEVHALASEPDGGMLVAAKYRGTVSLGGNVLPEAQLGTRRFVIAKVGADGELAWASTFPTDEESGHVSDIAATRDGNVVVAGYLGAVDLGDGPLTNDGAFSIVKLRP